MVKFTLSILFIIFTYSANGQKREYITINKSNFISKFNLPIFDKDITYVRFKEESILAYSRNKSLFSGEKFSILKRNNHYVMLVEHIPFRPLLPFNRGIKVDSVQLSEEFTLSLQKLFVQEFKVAKEDKSQRVGFDGAYYYFFTKGKSNENLFAEVWSPAASSSTNQLINICYEIIRKSHKKKFPEKRLIKKIKSLIEE